MSWIVAAPKPDIGPRLFVAAGDNAWTDSLTLARRFKTEAEADEIAEQLEPQVEASVEPFPAEWC